MDLKDMILVIENDRGTETNMLMTLDDYKSFIAIDDMSELADNLLQLGRTLGEADNFTEYYRAANVTVSARFCLDDIQLGHFLQGFYNDSKKFRFDKEASSSECVAKLKEIGMTDKGWVDDFNLHYEMENRSFERGQTFHNFNDHDYMVLEALSPRNLVVMDMKSGSLTIALGATEYKRYPKDEKDINVSCSCNLDTLAKKPIEFLENCILDQIKSIIDSLKKGEYEYVAIDEPLTYRYIEEPEDLLTISELANLGATRMDSYQDMLKELSEVYIDEMKDTSPDFEDCDTQIKETATQLSYIMESAAANTCLDGMDELSARLQEGLENNEFSDEDAKEVKACIETYMEELRPANSIITEAAAQVQMQTEQMDTEYKYTRLRRVREDNEDSTGVDTLESKDYDKLYNEMESVITKYFPPGSGKGLFNFTDEPMFYEMLNEARDEAGCAVIPTEVEKENNTLSLDGYRMLKKSVYIPRLD